MSEEIKERKFGVGMPAELYLHQFASHVLDAFDQSCGIYLVGSALEHRQWRDVDVRLILFDDDYAKHGFGDPYQATHNAKWVAMTMAFSALGRHMTGLPIDFQIDQQTFANKRHKDKHRSALGLVAHRFAKEEPSHG